MSSAFSLTDYKIQDLMLTVAILDLKHDQATKRQNSSYIKYCSTYVQLSRLRSLDGLHLLQKIDKNDIQFQPHPQLLIEMERLKVLEQKTILAWLNDQI